MGIKGFSKLINRHSGFTSRKINDYSGRWIAMDTSNQLFKFKIIEQSLSLNEMVRINKKGDMSMHPLYKEMRECIKLIDGLWTRIGMKNFLKGSGSVVDSEDFFSGDADYYSTISADEEVE